MVLSVWILINDVEMSKFIIIYHGSGSVILLRPKKMGLVPPKHDLISMPTQQYANKKHIPMERYHPVVSIITDRVI